MDFIPDKSICLHCRHCNGVCEPGFVYDEWDLWCVEDSENFGTLDGCYKYESEE